MARAEPPAEGAPSTGASTSPSSTSPSSTSPSSTSPSSAGASAAKASGQSLLELGVKGGSVYARWPGSSGWSTQLVADSSRVKLSDWVTLDESAFGCVGHFIYELSVADGRVLRRTALPGACQKLELKHGMLQVRTGAESWSASYLVGDELSGIPFFLTPEVMSFGKAQAELLKATARWGPARDRELRERGDLANAVRELERRTAKDATNPWFDFFRGDYLRILGARDKAHDAYKSALEHASSYDYELLPIAAALDQVAPKLGERAFDRGMKFLLGAGFEPELALGLQTTQRALDLETRTATVAQTPAYLELLSNRLADFSPQVEGSAFFYQAMRSRAIEQKEADDAIKFQKRREKAAQLQRLGVPQEPVQRARYWLNAAWALLLSFGAFVILKTIQTFRVTFARRAPWYARLNPTSRWSRGEQLGLVLAYCLLIFIGAAVAPGVALVRASSSAPIALGSGSFGHPEVVEFTRGMQGAAGGQFVHALALYHAGQLEEAAALYRGLAESEPAAEVNLGVVLAARGHPDEARQQWEAALAHDPMQSEAAHNIGLLASGSLRPERARRYEVEEPLLAMPNQAHWEQAWLAYVRQTAPAAFGNPLRAAVLAFDASAEMNGVPKLGMLLYAYLPLFALSLFALVVSFRTPPPLIHTRSRAGWILGLLLPGGARRYGVLGPFVCAVCCALPIGAWMFNQTAGFSASMLDATTLAPFSRYFGVSADYRGLGQTLLDESSQWFWVPWLVHYAFVLILERGRAEADLAPSFAPGALVDRLH